MTPARHAAAAVRSFAVYLAAGLRANRVYVVDCFAGLVTYPLELALTYAMWQIGRAHV